MSKFADILDGAAVTTATKFGMVYTCHCGWLDLGHANPTSTRPFVGATNLWTQILSETGPSSANKLWHQVRLDMTMSKTFPLVGRVTDGVNGVFAVRVGLTVPQKEQVALSIFMQVSRDFETLQGSGIYGLATDSGFSAEDLISNLMGFYAAVRTGTDFIALCKPVSKSAAEAVWNTHGAPGSDENKNRTTDPLLFPCTACPSAPAKRSVGKLPAALQAITELPIGTDYKVWDPTDPDQSTIPPAPPPTPAAPPAAPPAAAGKTLPVVKGVTLSGVALAEYQDWRLWPLLWDANRATVGPNPNRLKIGTSLSVPSLGSFTAQQRADAIRGSSSWKLYPR